MPGALVKYAFLFILINLSNSFIYKSSDPIRKRKVNSENIATVSPSTLHKKKKKSSKAKKDLEKVVFDKAEKERMISIANIFNSALNNFEKKKYAKVLSEHSEADCVLILDYIGKGENTIGTKYIEVCGAAAVVAFWDNVFKMLPDGMFNIKQIQTTALPNKFASIACQYVYTGTKLYNIDVLSKETGNQAVLIMPMATSLLPNFEAIEGKAAAVDSDPLILASVLPTLPRADVNGSNNSSESSESGQSGYDSGSICNNTCGGLGQTTVFGVNESNIITNASLDIKGVITYYLNPNNKVCKIYYAYDAIAPIGGGNSSSSSSKLFTTDASTLPPLSITAATVVGVSTGGQNEGFNPFCC